MWDKNKEYRFKEKWYQRKKSNIAIRVWYEESYLSEESQGHFS